VLTDQGAFGDKRPTGVDATVCRLIHQVFAGTADPGRAASGVPG
jgi:hypothetical protein